MKPKKAEVLVDGTVLGQARDFNGSWDLLQLPPGRHEIELRYEGHQTLRLYVDVEAGGYYAIHERLLLGEGLDSRSQEPPPEEPAAVSAPRAPARNKPRTSLQAEVRGQPSALRTGLLSLSVRPADAAVYLDGDFLAQADELARLHGAIPVAEGEHLVEVVRPGYAAQRHRIRVDAQGPARLTVELVPEP